MCFLRPKHDVKRQKGITTTMTYIDHKKYISSREWLLKKNKLISIYLEEGWDICCNICGATSDLNVHHRSYKQLGNENLNDDGSGDIWNLEFLCRDCHRKWHFNNKFKDEIIKKRDKQFFNDLTALTKEYGEN